MLFIRTIKLIKVGGIFRKIACRITYFNRIIIYKLFLEVPGPAVVRSMLQIMSYTPRKNESLLGSWVGAMLIQMILRGSIVYVHIT